MEPTRRRSAAPAQQLGSSTLFDTNKFGGYFFLDSELNHTVFTELIKKYCKFPFCMPTVALHFYTELKIALGQ